MTIEWHKIQDKWQREWEKAELGKVTTSKKPKFFMIFAYPGVSGFLHVGHMRGFSYTDAICRYERLHGKEVLFPVGTHASGNQAIAFANKVKNNDEEWINYLKKNGCPESKINELTTADNIIEYFNDVYVNEYWKKFGFLCDWDRFTSTTHKDYEKFIQWQFRKLQQRDLLVQKPYFATACVVDGPVAVDPSETDLSKGGNAEKQEYTLLKFKLGDDYLIAATLRPETMYGQTNLWINPNGKYVRIQVNGENWIVSEEAAEKLKWQKDDVMLLENIDPVKLIGQTAFAPFVNKDIIVLPAPFCNPAIGSGIVTSVPSDAPFDYVALTTLQEDHEECRKYGLNPEEVQRIPLIPIIKSKGYGDFPAQEIVQKMGIRSLNDPKLEEATKEIYKVGHHTGVMRDNCEKFAGMKVEQAKELMKAELLEEDNADILHDLSEEVICRCGNKVVIKRIDDQWFIKYSDQEITDKTKEHVKSMNIYPHEFKEHLPGILDWFADRACTRLGNWLGSTFPFDDTWTVEPISDSTLYPCYYIVSKFVQNGTVSIGELDETFFDYVYLGIGEGKESWKPIRAEFEYFYPLDMNLGGKEHKTVHFPVFLMNHVAILPKDKWPKGIFANWWVTGKGSKISKSKGGAEPIPNAIATYGVDAMRLYYAHIGSPHVDVVWDESVVGNYKHALERIYSLVTDAREKQGSKSSIDVWLISRLHEHIQSVSEKMKEYNLRDLASTVYFTMQDDFRWYLRRGGFHKSTIDEFIETWCVLMNPITPHLSEEMSLQDGLVSVRKWPEARQDKISRNANAGEALLKVAMDGMRNVMKLAKIDKPEKFTLFVAEGWLYPLFEVLSREVKVTRNVGEVMKKVLEQEELKMKGKEVSKIVMSIVKDPSKLPHFTLSQEEEIDLVKNTIPFLEKEFGCSVEIGDEPDHPKAKSSMPGKVGILVE